VLVSNSMVDMAGMYRDEPTRGYRRLTRKALERIDAPGFVHALNRHAWSARWPRRRRRVQHGNGERLQSGPTQRLDRRQWATREQLQIAIVTWTERTCHRRRRQTRLGRLTPIEYETIMTTAAEKAA